MDENEKKEVTPTDNAEVVQKVNDTVAECVSKLESGEVQTKDELIDLLVEKLTALKDVESALGGLGMEEGMKLPEEEEGQEA